MDFHIDLHGSLHVKYLPLADKFLSYSYNCSTTCTIGPIPPAEYEMSLTSTGSIPISDTLELPLGKTLEKQYSLVHELLVTPGEVPEYSESIRSALIENLTQGKEDTARFIGWRDQTHIYAEKMSQNGESLLGIMGTNGFVPLKSFSSPPQEIHLDETGEYFLLSYSSGETNILKRDLSEEFVVSTQSPIRSITGYPNQWKVRTLYAVYDYDGEKLRENPRFTDYIDLDTRYRLGYIDAQDVQKLQLSNLPLGN
jgi:hypothetical protein